MIRTWTSHLAPARSPILLFDTFRALATQFVLENATVRAATISQDFTQCCTCHEKWHSNITKCCALPGKVRLQHHQMLYNAAHATKSEMWRMCDVSDVCDVMCDVMWWDVSDVCDMMCDVMWWDVSVCVWSDVRCDVVRCEWCEWCVMWGVMWDVSDVCCDWCVMWVMCAVIGVCCDCCVTWVTCAVIGVWCEWCVLWLLCDVSDVWCEWFEWFEWCVMWVMWVMWVIWVMCGGVKTP